MRSFRALAWWSKVFNVEAVTEACCGENFTAPFPNGAGLHVQMEPGSMSKWSQLLYLELEMWLYLELEMEPAALFGVTSRHGSKQPGLKIPNHSGLRP